MTKRTSRSTGTPRYYHSRGKLVAVAPHECVLDNQGTCHWCGRLMDRSWWESYAGKGAPAPTAIPVRKPKRTSRNPISPRAIKVGDRVALSGKPSWHGTVTEYDSSQPWTLKVLWDEVAKKHPISLFESYKKVVPLKKNRRTIRMATNGESRKVPAAVEKAVKAARLYHGSSGCLVRDQQKLYTRMRRALDAVTQKYGDDAERQILGEAKRLGAILPVPGKDV